MSRCNKFESIFKYTKTSKAKVIYSTLRLFRNVTISTTFGSKFVEDIQWFYRIVVVGGTLSYP